MVNDVLSMLKNSITTYANVITEAENPQFRQTVQQLGITVKHSSTIFLM